MRIRHACVQTCIDLKVAKYYGVTYSRNRWVARVQQKILGRYTTEQEAANRVAAALGVGVRVLRKTGKPKYLAKRLFHVAYPIFKEYVPGDYQSMIDHETTSARMFRQVF